MSGRRNSRSVPMPGSLVAQARRSAGELSPPRHVADSSPATPDSAPVAEAQLYAMDCRHVVDEMVWRLRRLADAIENAGAARFSQERVEAGKPTFAESAESIMDEINDEVYRLRPHRLVSYAAHLERVLLRSQNAVEE